MMRTTFVMSVLCCALAAPVWALEPLDGEEVPEIDFRDTTPPQARQQSARVTDDTRKEGRSTAGDRSSGPHARPSANSYLFVSHWDALDRDQDGYSLRSPSRSIEFGFSWSVHEYASLGISRAESSVTADYDPVTSYDFWASEKTTVERTVSTDQEQDSVDVVLYLLGRSASTPFLGWRRWRGEGSLSIEDTVTVSPTFGSPTSIDVYNLKLTGARVYGTTWSAGYEYALSPGLALSAQAFHSIANESNVRWVVVNADLGVANILRFNIGLSRSNETGDKRFGVGLKFLF